MSRWLKYSGATVWGQHVSASAKLAAETTLTLCRRAAQVADVLLPSLDERAPRIDVAPASLAPRRPGLAKVDDGDWAFFGAESGERLNDETERELRREGEIVGSGQVVGRHADEPRIAVA